MKPSNLVWISSQAAASRSSSVGSGGEVVVAGFGASAGGGRSSSSLPQADAWTIIAAINPVIARRRRPRLPRGDIEFLPRRSGPHHSEREFRGRPTRATDIHGDRNRPL